MKNSIISFDARDIKRIADISCHLREIVGGAAGLVRAL